MGVHIIKLVPIIAMEVANIRMLQSHDVKEGDRRWMNYMRKSHIASHVSISSWA
jgi:hypothetical protein